MLRLVIRYFGKKCSISAISSLLGPKRGKYSTRNISIRLLARLIISIISKIDIPSKKERYPVSIVSPAFENRREN